MGLTYTFKESFAGFRRNRVSSFITIFTVSISLLLLGIFTIITVNFSQLVEDVRSRVEVEVFLKDRITSEHRDRTRELLSEIRGIDEIEYVSKEDAAKSFEQEVGETFYDILDDNPLPASFRLHIAEVHSNADSVEVIAKRAKQIWTVDDVVYRKQFLSLIDRRAKAFQFATLFIGIVLSISAIILVANTIKLTIYAKRELIRTMKLVGATSMFIRLPFLLEGLFHGLIGGVFASILIGIAFVMFIQPLSDDLLVHISLDFTFYVFLTGMGCVLGLLGSIFSVGHFLKETVVAGT